MADFNPVIPSNYTTFPHWDQTGESESQKQGWQFELEDRRAFKPVDDVPENKRSSPTASPAQYNLTLAKEAEAESEKTEKGQSQQESHES